MHAGERQPRESPQSAAAATRANAGASEPRAAGQAAADERGAALIVAVLMTAVIASLAAMLLLSTTVEMLAAFNFRSAGETFMAATAGLELALPDLAAAADWSAVLDGTAGSAFTDGAPGPRTLAGGRTLDLRAVENLANCGHSQPCSPAELSAVTIDRPWGANNPRWLLFQHGTLGALAGAQATVSACYVVVMVADDPEETDNDPTRDGTPGTSPGAGILRVRSEAFGAAGAHRVIEATVARPAGAAGAPPALRLVAWHELREPGV